MGTIPYCYARSLEFEGRSPQDGGQWGVTNMRLQYLEGLPEIDEYMIGVNADGTYQQTPLMLRKSFWPNRIRLYRRIRTANEVAHVMSRRGALWQTKVSIPLFASWLNPVNGKIPMPTSSDILAPDTHAIQPVDFFRQEDAIVEGESHAKHFVFQNTWGTDWGNEGCGYLPFAYYDKYAFEHWAVYFTPTLRQFQQKKLKPGWYRWHARDEFDQKLYAFEAGDPEGERHGWAFAIETADAIEVEELFVAPTARRAGIGGELASLVVQLAQAKSLPIRVWVSFADTARESPATALALPAMAKRLGVQFHPSPVRWAAYYASNIVVGSPTPIEPNYMPNRPRSTLGALMAFAASAGITTAIPNHSLSNGLHNTCVVEERVLTLDSPEWESKNKRRATLIYKKNRDGLDPHEIAELENLQKLARTLVESAEPRSALFGPELDAILVAKGLR